MASLTEVFMHSPVARHESRCRQDVPMVGSTTNNRCLTRPTKISKGTVSKLAVKVGAIVTYEKSCTIKIAIGNDVYACKTYTQAYNKLYSIKRYSKYE